jgi:2-phosphosulfolactate phosphatase
MNCIEVCFTPKIYPEILTRENFIVVLVDILRATTTICTAFENGVKAILPVATPEEAKELKAQGFLVASERISGRVLVYCTTNGTRALEIAKSAEQIVIGAFINISAVNDWLIKEDKNVVILCSGWKNKFCLEDTLFAGALSERLLQSGKFITTCDATMASIDLWGLAKGDILAYIEKAAHRHRLKKLGLDDVIPYSFTADQTRVVPKFNGKEIVK